MRARDLGIVLGDGSPGPFNAITDVPDVHVGYSTLIEGDSTRTGVTVIVPRAGAIAQEPAFAACHRLNGNGELTGSWWIRESGLLTTPIGITNTHSVGLVHDAIVAAARRYAPDDEDGWSLPVVAETWDGVLNDIDAMRVRAEHIDAALAAASSGPVAEGNVGGGTGMICHGFKGGTGTSSRALDADAGGYTVGVLVQANYGGRRRLRIDGVPVGEVIGPDVIPTPERPSMPGSGSIIVVVATDAPLLPHQCERLAQRAGLGVGRMGGAGEDSSGDLFIAFATGNRGLGGDAATRAIEMLAGSRMNPLSYAVIDATEEAIANALVAADTMTGYRGATAYRLDHERLRAVMEQYGRARAG